MQNRMTSTSTWLETWASLSGARSANRPLDLLGELVLALPVACHLADANGELAYGRLATR